MTTNCLSAYSYLSRIHKPKPKPKSMAMKEVQEYTAGQIVDLINLIPFGRNKPKNIQVNGVVTFTMDKTRYRITVFLACSIINEDESENYSNEAYLLEGLLVTLAECHFRKSA